MSNNMYLERGKNLYSPGIIPYCILIVLLILNSRINNVGYSIVVVIYALYLAFASEPLYLIVPCLLCDIIQGLFLITPTLSFSRVLSFIFIFSCIIKKRVSFNIRDPKTFFLILFMFYHVASGLWSVSGQFNEPISFGIGMIMILVLSSIESDAETGNKIIKLLSFMSYAFGGYIGVLTISMSNQLKATQVVFDDSLNANTVCGALAVFICIIYSKSLTGKIKIYDVFFILYCIIAVVVVGSRTSLLGIMCVLIIMPYVSGKYKLADISKLIKPLLFISIIVIVLFNFIKSNEALMARFSLEKSTTVSVDRRVYIWQALVNHIIPNHFLIGIGYGINNVRLAVTPYVEYVFHSHNMYLAIISELGIVGLLMYLHLYIENFKIIINNKNIGTIISFSVFLLGLVLGVGEEVINRRWFWLILGLLLYFNNSNISKSKEDKNSEII